MSFNLENKVAVITGGAGVLCNTMAIAMAERGAKIAVLDLRQENAQKVADEITAAGGKTIGVACNLSKQES
jgi:NAD(P)-dependent dehydrogenase (short-subunit alcohol dehydrogenase family)